MTPGPLALAILATLAGILAAGLFVGVLAWHARRTEEAS